MMHKISVLALLVVLTGCSGKSAPLIADDLEVSLPRPGTVMGVAYMRITNTTPAAITITGVSSPEFEAVEIHETEINDGISRMRRLESVTIPAEGSVSFEHGGKHLMLMRPKGEVERMTLTFNADAIPVLTVSISGTE